jgi:hypothetical protein
MKVVVEFFGGIWGDHTKIAHTIREGLKQKEKGDLTQGWKAMSDALADVTIYGFMETIEEILLGPRHHPQESQFTVRGGSAAPSPRDYPSVELPFTKWVSKFFQRRLGRQEIKDLLDDVNRLIMRKQNTLADGWIQERKQTLAKWGFALLDDSNGLLDGSNGTA